MLPQSDAEFAQWHARWQEAVLAHPGAISFEYWPPAPPDQDQAVIAARFESVESLRAWRSSDRHRSLIAEATPLVEAGIIMQIAGAAAAEYFVKHATTEVVITQIKAGKVDEYRKWADRIQKVQESFPGYLGSFVQPPHQNETGWTTVLRFDTPENLDAWLNSKQRKTLIDEGQELIEQFHAQRVDTSFPGWVPNNPVTGKPPAAWKTGALVLLTLFPVVMLELRFLNPILKGLQPALITFIGNALSIIITTFLLMPSAVRIFHRWIFPEDQDSMFARMSPLIIVICYAIEIAVLWRLL